MMYIFVALLLFGIAGNAYAGSAEIKLIPNTQGCWSKCGDKGGLCPIPCGANGYCCRKGWLADCAEEISAANPYDQHACVLYIPEKTGISLIINTRGCWLGCGMKGGSCPTMCGKNGFCCRKGYTDCPEKVAEVNPFPQHACILNNPVIPSVSTSESPSVLGPGVVRQCGVSNEKRTYIIGGVDATPNAWPWMASLQQLTNHLCGASLITPTWALTAAHCAKWMNAVSLRQYSIKLGAHDNRAIESSVQQIKIKRFINHPNWNTGSLVGDLTLLELEEPAVLNDKVNLVCLPKKDEYPTVGKECVIAGWGNVKLDGYGYHTLQEAKLPIADRNMCNHIEDICVGKGRAFEKDGTRIANACSGDSGGPLACPMDDGRYVLDGVASYVFKNCEDYTAYAPVNKYIDWINSYIKS